MKQPSSSVVALFFRLLLLSVLPSLASAQATDGFSINRFDVSERGSDWFVGDSLDLRGQPFRPSVGFVMDYAHKPLVLYSPMGDERAVIVRDQLFAHFGASAVIVGHSERRSAHRESDSDVKSKALAAARAGLSAILCVGETDEERKAGATLARIERQLDGSLPDKIDDELSYFLSEWRLKHRYNPGRPS